MKIQVYETEGGWRWRAIARNGKIVASGEEYNNKYDLYRALGILEAILSTDIVEEIPRKHNPGDYRYRKHDMEYADEQRAANEREKKFDDSFKPSLGTIRSPHPDRGLL